MVHISNRVGQHWHILFLRHENSIHYLSIEKNVTYSLFHSFEHKNSCFVLFYVISDTKCNENMCSILRHT